ncbi:MAG: DUF3299 domain-containing protein [Rickettsiales bacterium]|nr:DUF3299 domain-containing protein [Rickettsiales bacterium]
MQEPTPEELELMMSEWKPLEVTGDAIPWHVFAQTKEIEECTTDAEGYTYCILKPEYSEAILKLDGQPVTLMGYMFPLQDADGQKNFLFGPYPLSCPFHYHVGPSQNVEILADEAIAFSYDPITIEGTLRVKFNADTEVFFYLENATPK